MFLFQASTGWQPLSSMTPPPFNYWENSIIPGPMEKITPVPGKPGRAPPRKKLQWNGDNIDHPRTELQSTRESFSEAEPVEAATEQLLLARWGRTLQLKATKAGFTDLWPMGWFGLLGIGEGRERYCGQHGIIGTGPWNSFCSLWHYHHLAVKKRINRAEWSWADH